MRIAIAGIMTIALAGLAACGSSSEPAGPGGGGGGGGPVGSVDVGPGIEFVSRHNGTVLPAEDTVAVGATVTWNWTGSLPHSVRSNGSPSFQSSSIMTGGTYDVQFVAPGKYRYDCAVHGAAMSGTVVVLSSQP